MESEYVAGLQKLARKYNGSESGSGGSGEGKFWERIMGEIVEVSIDIPSTSQ